MRRSAVLSHTLWFKVLLRVSSTTVSEYGFQVGGELQSKDAPDVFSAHAGQGMEEPAAAEPSLTLHDSQVYAAVTCFVFTVSCRSLSRTHCISK